MSKQVKLFTELTADEWPAAGGKGGTLARLYQAGYPVPNGFVILPAAFTGEEITNDGWDQVQTYLARSRNGAQSESFSVRSSALSEDSALASFAGEFETVLDVRSDEMIREAIQTVRRSRLSERVHAYSRAKGMETAHEIAVIVQKMIHADLSGILFTADPVTGSRLTMSGNYVYGLGDQLVSGEAEPYTFTLTRPKGTYAGPPELKRFARKLFKLAARLEKELGSPQDIEWCIADDQLYLLQSRPITTLVGYDPATGFWNSSHTGDYLWFNHEVFPDVLTPSTWSIWQTFQQFNVGDIPGLGNIGGRLYMNYSMVSGLMKAVGSSEEAIREQVVLTAGILPSGVKVPEVPLARWGLLKAILPVMFELLPKQLRLKRHFAEIIASNPQRCRDLQEKIKREQTKHGLVALWQEDIFPYFQDLLQLQDKTNEDYFNPYKSLKKDLIKAEGEGRANEILSSLTVGSEQLASLGPIVGLARLAKGEISRHEYELLAGHRPPKENELASPRPYEDPAWIDKQLAEYNQAPLDIKGMIANRAAESDAVWKSLELEHPGQVGKWRKKLNQINEGMQRREQIRSELTRFLGVMRDWFLRSAELAGLSESEDIFFLSFHEVINVLSGDETMVVTIPARREMNEKLNALPPYPMFINGRFDPFQWAQDPNRRSDIFDSHSPIPVPESDVIEGYPGSSGRVEGLIRYLTSPDQGSQLQEGEILLASTTNIGWTPLFPRAAAVITDIGAPLSHAAIVARELGIPAVVGTGNATMRLRTGDRVLVDGSRGIVEIVDEVS